MLFTIIRKELLLAARDIHALLVLFLMPTAFILIMSLSLQDSFHKSEEEKRNTREQQIITRKLPSALGLNKPIVREYVECEICNKEVASYKMNVHLKGHLEGGISYCIKCKKRIS